MLHRLLAEANVPRDGANDNLRRVRSVVVNLAESPLSWLKARNLVTDRQFAAGEQLRRDYETAQLSPSVTMRWDATAMNGGKRAGTDPGQSTIVQISAKQRFLAAVDHAGPGLSDILWRVVCAGEGVPIAEKQLGWPTRSGRLVLTLALDRIATYYRIV